MNVLISTLYFQTHMYAAVQCCFHYRKGRHLWCEFHWECRNTRTSVSHRHSYIATCQNTTTNTDMTYMEVLKHDREVSQATDIKVEVLNCHALRKRLANYTRSFLQSLQLLSWLRSMFYGNLGTKFLHRTHCTTSTQIIFRTLFLQVSFRTSESTYKNTRNDSNECIKIDKGDSEVRPCQGPRHERNRQFGKQRKGRMDRPRTTNGTRPDWTNSDKELRSKNKFMDISSLEEETIILYRNARYQTPIKVKSHPRRTETWSFETPHTR